MKENWRPVVGYEALYEVSDLGRVRSPRTILKPGKTGPYFYVNLSKGGVTRMHSVHKLVLTAFIGPCPKDKECRHFPDHNGSNNRLDNLSWATHSENIGDKYHNGTDYNGESNPSAKLTEQNVRDLIRERGKGKTYSQLSKMFGIGVSHAHRIVKGTRWKLMDKLR